MASFDLNKFKAQLMKDFDELFNEKEDEQMIGFEEVDTTQNEKYTFHFEYDGPFYLEMIIMLNRLNIKSQKKFIQAKAWRIGNFDLFKRHKKLEMQCSVSGPEHSQKLTIYYIYWDIV